MKRNNFFFWIGVFLPIFAILNILYFDIQIIAGPDTLQVLYIPDDAYYYLNLARNFTHFHTWTFDSGISKTTGFHLLYAYILAFFYEVFQPTTGTFVVIALVVCSVTTIVVSLYAIWLGIKNKDGYFLLSLAIVISSFNFVSNSISGVEWPFVVLIAALFCGTLYNGLANKHLGTTLFVLGLLGSLARSDFVLLPASFFVATVCIWVYKKDKALLFKAFMGVIGAVGGIIVLLFHNYWFTGSWMQSSAIIKLHWAKYLSVSWLQTLSTALTLVGGSKHGLSLTLLLVSFLPLTCIILLHITSRIVNRRHNVNPDRVVVLASPSRGTIFVLAAIFIWCGYLILYQFNADVQWWYTANFVVPTCILITGLGHYLEEKVTKTPAIAFLLLALPAFLIYQTNIQALYPIGFSKSLWPHQQANLAAGKYLYEHPVKGNIAAWNAGIIGYYQGGNVINIDGLVNNDVYPYIVSNSLPTYIYAKNVTYIIDSQSMLEIRYRVRGGYNVPDFVQKLVPIKVFETGDNLFWKPLTLYLIQK